MSITIVQQPNTPSTGNNQATNTNANSLSITPVSQPTANNLLVIVSANGAPGSGTGGISSISGLALAGHSWAKAVALANSNQQGADIWYVLTGGGAGAITINYNGTGPILAGVYELSGTQAVVDKSSSSSGSASNSFTTTTGTTATTANANDILIVSLFTSAAAFNNDLSAGYTDSGQTTISSSTGTGDFAYQIVSSTGAYVATRSGSRIFSTVFGVGVIAAFEATLPTNIGGMQHFHRRFYKARPIIRSRVRRTGLNFLSVGSYRHPKPFFAKRAAKPKRKLTRTHASLNMLAIWAFAHRKPRAQPHKAYKIHLRDRHPILRISQYLISLSTTSAATTSLVNQILKLLSVVSSSTTALIKTVYKIFLSVVSTTASQTKIIGKLISVISTAILSIRLSIIKILNMVVSSVPIQTLMTAHLVLISTVATAISTMTRSINKLLSIISTSSGIIHLLMGKLLSVVSSTTVNISKVINTILTNVVVSITHTIQKAISTAKFVLSTNTINFVKQVGKLLSASSTSALVQSVSRLYQEILAIVSTTTIAISKTVNTFLSLIVDSFNTIRNSLTKTLTAASTGLAVSRSMVSKILNAVSSSLAAINAHKIAQILLSTISTATANMSRLQALKVLLSITSNSINSINKILTKSLTITSIAIITLFKQMQTALSVLVTNVINQVILPLIQHLLVILRLAIPPLQISLTLPVASIIILTMPVTEQSLPTQVSLALPIADAVVLTMPVTEQSTLTAPINAIRGN